MNDNDNFFFFENTQHCKTITYWINLYYYLRTLSHYASYKGIDTINFYIRIYTFGGSKSKTTICIYTSITLLSQDPLDTYYTVE